MTTAPRYPYRQPNGKFGHACVENLPPDVVFLSDTQDTQELRDMYPEYDSFFVIQHEAEIHAIWGMQGIIPGLVKHVERVL